MRRAMEFSLCGGQGAGEGLSSLRSQHLLGQRTHCVLRGEPKRFHQSASGPGLATNAMVNRICVRPPESNMLSLLLISLIQAQAPQDTPQSVPTSVKSSTLPQSTAPTLALRQRAASELRTAVDSARAGGLEELAALRAAADSAASILGTHSQNTARITRALAANETPQRNIGEKATLSALSKELDRIARDLAFSPLIESPRPVGFPAATIVGEIEVLDYPTYRMARALMPRSIQGRQNNAFWKLFSHIKAHDIPMTAPVEMRWGADGVSMAFESMSFLYVSTEVGRTGPDGEVEVLDVPAATVVSIGSRGASDRKRVDAERELLHAWIVSQPQRFEIIGPPRMMGWNSPMVADAQRYWEVQYPVRVLPELVEAKH